jgi:hypothetical protein
MHSVFVAGSRTLSRLNPQIKERLDNIIDRNLAVLIGDANGADKAIQRYLAKREYGRVTVYCMEICRNNVGEWPIRSHEAEPGTKRDRYYYAIKDAAMAKNATCGFMLWDGLSKGTLANTINLLNADKKVVLYISPRKKFFNLHTLQDFHQALRANGIGDVFRLMASMGIKEAASERLPFDTATVIFPH